MTSARYHCEFAWLGGDTVVADVLLEVADGRIAAITHFIDPGVFAEFGLPPFLSDEKP